MPIRRVGILGGPLAILSRRHRADPDPPHDDCGRFTVAHRRRCRHPRDSDCLVDGQECNRSMPRNPCRHRCHRRGSCDIRAGAVGALCGAGGGRSLSCRGLFHPADLVRHVLATRSRTVVTGFARQIRRTMPDKVVRYTRLVTIAWCVFFATQLAVSRCVAWSRHRRSSGQPS